MTTIFKAKPDATFTFTADIPNGDKPLPLKLIGKRKSREELDAWQKGARENNDPEFLGEVVVGWEGHEKPFSAEAFVELLTEYNGSGWSIYLAYLNAYTVAARKN